MSIETMIQNLTTAIEANTQAINSLAEAAAASVATKTAEPTKAQAKKAAKKTAPKKTEKAEPAEESPEVEAEAEEAPEAEAPSVTHDDLKELLGKLVKASNDPKAPRVLLKNHGFTKLSDIPDDKVVVLFSEAQELYDQAG